MNTTSMFLRLINRTRQIYPINSISFQSAGCRCSSAYAASVPQIAKERETFQDAWKGIIDNLTTNKKFTQLPELGSWVKKVLEYNVKGGKKIRGITTVLAYELFEKPENVTEEMVRLARVAGWCTEMLQAYLIMNDDIMDGSSTRRGVPCWYRMPDVGLGAINDAILVYGSIYEILKIYFGKAKEYADILDIFNEALLYTSMGQHLDYAMAHRNKQDYSLFTTERYYSIVKYKTSYYSIKLPVVLGLILTQNRQNAPIEDIEGICFEIGKLFQIQDDFMDCFGNETVTGKKGTDIQEGKCSWLAVNALQRCDEAQRKLFAQNYASKNTDDVASIKRLYEDLQLPKLYKEQEDEIHSGILKKINALPSSTSPAIFFKLLDMIFKRSY
ncbi:farnesyl diphosphate synthase 3 [Bombyx mori]|uniref:Farnesyl pyrophosphate synthase n=1 Tax=Bombyx mori TaxID=7091 RepID=A5A7A6_BOMMO|nr:farnesyl diphosphate synthase 3 [Bombyx mori]BAF62115.1 farnesyl diphosphate synthase 3 [Bombyx mori]